MKRCDWCGNKPLYQEYHDREWGRPVKESQALFEKFILDSFQAGLSWYIILQKRDAFRDAFDNFDPVRIVQYNSQKVQSLLANEKIIRHAGKINATITNAQAYLRLVEKQSFSDFLWQYVDDKPIKNHFKAIHDLPTQTPLSTKISKDLKKRGFKFCGPVMVYAFMQAVGIVNDHLTTCDLYHEKYNT